MIRRFWLMFYYCFAKNLPDSYLPIVGPICNNIRIFTCKRIFKKTGKISVMQKNVHFGSGADIEIGNYSGIGKNAVIPSNTKIGNYVMIAQDLYIVANNHPVDDVSIPMCLQHSSFAHIPTTIGNDVWIGARVTIMPGCDIADGCVIGAGAVLTKKTAPYEIWGGVPAKRIKNRKNE